LTGGATGAVAGAALYPVASGVGAFARTWRNRAAARRAAADLGVSPAATRRLGRAVTDDRLTPAQAAQRSGELGPEGMVLDLSPQLAQQAETIATISGRGQAVVLDAVRNRSAGATQRITDTLDQTIGPAQGRVATAEQIEQAYRGAARRPRGWRSHITEGAKRHVRAAEPAPRVLVPAGPPSPAKAATLRQSRPSPLPGSATCRRSGRDRQARHGNQ
jgi:hypothetical protein